MKKEFREYDRKGWTGWGEEAKRREREREREDERKNKGAKKKKKKKKRLTKALSPLHARKYCGVALAVIAI